MSNGTAPTYKIGSMGNIKDLLMQSQNSESEPMPWRRSGNDNKEDDSRTERVSLHNDENKESEKETAANEDKKSEPQTAVPSSPDSEANKEMGNVVQENPKTIKPQPKPDQRNSPKASQPVRQYKNGSFKDIENLIINFDIKKENCRRHWIQLPKDVAALLYYAYGEKRLSATLSVIAREHIKNFKNDIRQKLAERNNLLDKQKD